MKSLIRILLVPACLAPWLLFAQTPEVPEWAFPGSATRTQVAPPPDFRRASTHFNTPIGIFEGQSDIGSALVPGSATFDANARTYTINSAGYNVWYTRDEFRYLWKKMSGDVSLAADIAYPDPEGFGDRKAVLAIRQDLDNPAATAMLALFEMLYPDWHPYGRPAKGTIETVGRIGRDDLVNFHHARFAPPLTTVHVPMHEVAVNGCRHLLNACYGLELPVQRAFPAQLVWRHSVAPGPHEEDLRRRLVAVAEAICSAMGCRELRLEVLPEAEALAPWYRELGYRDGIDGDGGVGMWMQKEILAA